jgi:beta-glucanase (GH16 family)
MRLIIFKTTYPHNLISIFYFFVLIFYSYGFSAGGWKLVWADSFDTYTGLLDSTKWSYQVGAGGWGNNESQYYTSKRQENCRVENGNLIIEARRDFWQNNEYTSARVRTINKGDWLYGRFEVRAKLPYGAGTWPAIWMMPTDNAYGGWPRSGEIDIMEHVGKDPGVIHFSTHSLKYYWRIGTQKTATIRADDCMNNYHIYAMEWSADTIRGYLDNTLYFTNLNEHSGWEAWPFDKRFHFILNIALGGDWGGPIDNSILPQRMYIDYVKVYQWDNSLDIKSDKLSQKKSFPFIFNKKDNVIMLKFEAQEKCRIEIFDILGKILYSKDYFDNKITILLNSFINKKLLFVKIKIKGKEYILKLN